MRSTVSFHVFKKVSFAFITCVCDPCYLFYEYYPTNTICEYSPSLDLVYLDQLLCYQLKMRS